MRITLESTNSEPQYSAKATIEVPCDGLTIDEVFESLIKPILVAYGFTQQTINNYLELDE